MERSYSEDEFKAHKARCARAWRERQLWQTLYDEVYDYVIPYRRPARSLGVKGAQRVDKLYDNTAMVSAFAGAGRLQQDLFSQPLFTFKIGPVAKKALQKGKSAQARRTVLQEATRELESLAEDVRAFFVSGEFDNAANEMCIDLIAGTGALFPLEGDDEDPIRFVCVPMDEIAIEADAYGGIAAIFWTTLLTRRQIMTAFKKARFPQMFTEAYGRDPDGEISIHQDWVKEGKRWEFRVWIEEGAADNTIIASDSFMAQPGAITRYHKVPGEAYGRGPGMLALPTAKTINKAVELMLKAAAIQMLGIWAYRPGGAFNPSTARFAPGAFWPMNSTGGVIGPDVTRLDPASARMDVAQLITSELRLQLQAAMNDDRLPDKGATPVSATEVMARMKRVTQNYLGAYGRLVNDTIPPLVRRVMEILHKRKLIKTKIRIDTLLIAIDVQSPMASMMKAQGLSQVFEFLQIVASLKGPQAIELLVKLDDLLRDAAQRMGVPAEFVMTADETKALEDKLAAAAAQMAAAQQLAAQAPQGPQPVPA
jgi:hypothetical protein